MKTYFFMLDIENRRGERIGKRVGVVFAENEEQAREKAWELGGCDTACKLRITEVDEKGFNYTVYKSEI